MRANRNGLVQRNNAGFTLIELLIAIAIIAILAALGTFAIQNALAKARDAQRQNDLKQLENALEFYRDDWGMYPVTSVANPPAKWGESVAFGTRTNNYIPDLAPKYIGKLPNDPRVGLKNLANTVSPGCPGSTSGYVYMSNGVDYKLLANCTPEGVISATDPLKDPLRPYSWSIYSSSVTNSW
jgi:prepilin-type N-terminal cleavage/methylation domain-containing protein